MKNNILHLAPMDGYTDMAFRRIVRDINSHVYVYSELSSAEGVRYKSDKTLKRIIPHISERDMYIPQLFGKNIENIEYASKLLVEEYGIKEININMGCPAKKVVSSGHGAYMINNFLSWKFYHEAQNDEKYKETIEKLVAHEHIADSLPIASKIVKAVMSSGAKASVKTRIGWKDKTDIFEFAKVLIDVGCTTLIVHGRTYNQAFKGVSDWNPIYELKNMYPNITIIGNGDVGLRPKQSDEIESDVCISCDDNILDEDKFKNDQRFGKGNIAIDERDIETIVNEYIGNLDGLMIGRASFGNPWIFAKDKPATFMDKIPYIHKHYMYCVEHKGLLLASKEMRKHLLAYVKGLPNATDMRRKLAVSDSWEEVQEIFKSICDK